MDNELETSSPIALKKIPPWLQNEMQQKLINEILIDVLIQYFARDLWSSSMCKSHCHFIAWQQNSHVDTIYWAIYTGYLYQILLWAAEICPIDDRYIATVNSLNSLVPWRFLLKFYKSCFQANFSYRWLRYLVKYVFAWMSLDLTRDKSTMVQVMTWCRQATIHLPEPMLT